MNQQLLGAANDPTRVPSMRGFPEEEQVAGIIIKVKHHLLSSSRLLSTLRFAGRIHECFAAHTWNTHTKKYLYNMCYNMTRHRAL